MRIELDVCDYSPRRGVVLRWDDDAEINVAIEDGAVTLSGNRAGLQTLARHLCTLAVPGVPSGAHVHLDADSGLNPGSTAIVIELSEPVARDAPHVQ